MTQRLKAGLRIAAVGLLALGAGTTARADSFLLNPFAGSPSQVKVNVSQTTINSLTAVLFKVDVVPTPNIGDLRGVFFNTSNDALLSGLVIEGPQVTKVVKNAGKITGVGSGNNINPTGAFDIGVEIGTAGIGKDDIQHTTFTVRSKTQNLSTSLFTSQANKNGYLFAARLTSVGQVGKYRGGSSKLGGSAPVPEPAFYQMTALLALGGIGVLRSCRKAARTK